MLQGKRDVGNEETDFRIKYLLYWQNIFSNRQIAADIEEKWASQGGVLRRGISPIYLSSSNKWRPCHWDINSRPRNFSAFDFSEILNKCGFKRGTVWEILRFIFQFSRKLYIQFWKYFHSMILWRLGKGYCNRKRVLENLVKIFGYVASAPLIISITDRTFKRHCK